MNYSFIRGEKYLADDEKGLIIKSLDGYASYLIVIDEQKRYIWAFLSKNKSPLIATINKLLDMHGIHNKSSVEEGLTKLIQFDGGGELADSEELRTIYNEEDIVSKLQQ